MTNNIEDQLQDSGQSLVDSAANGEQAFVQGELGKHGCYLEEIQNISCIG
jgi:hypothetical protein